MCDAKIHGNIRVVLTMDQVRDIARIFMAYETLEGAGVRLHRAIGFDEVPLFDPFLLFDDFRAKRPEDYLAGFPWHPHRGIETVTYMLDGLVEHSDSMGNAGTIGAGDIQWMTAGSGIIHQEMPKPLYGRMGGFQLLSEPAPGRQDDETPVPGNQISTGSRNFTTGAGQYTGDLRKCWRNQGPGDGYCCGSGIS